MLSYNTFLKTRIQRLLDCFIFVEQGLGVHAQCMIKMSRGLYKAKYFEKKKTEGKLGTFFGDHDLTN